MGRRIILGSELSFVRSEITARTKEDTRLTRRPKLSFQKSFKFIASVVFMTVYRCLIAGWFVFVEYGKQTRSLNYSS